MSEIKPVYQSLFIETEFHDGWRTIDKQTFEDRSKLVERYQVRILYPAAAYEALKAENEALRQESANYENASKITNSWNLEIADSNGNLRQENEALRKQVEMLLGSARKTVLALAHASIHDPLYTAAYDELSESIKLASKKWRSK